MTITATQVVYYGFNLAGGAVALPVLLLTTVLSRRVKKQPVLINMYIACVYEAMLACLLWALQSKSAVSMMIVMIKPYTACLRTVILRRKVTGSSREYEMGVLFVLHRQYCLCPQMPCKPALTQRSCNAQRFIGCCSSLAGAALSVVLHVLRTRTSTRSI